MTFGVGEHAAQLARTQAMAVARDRRRRPEPGGLDVAALRELAEEYIALRGETPGIPALGTDRSKVTQFLNWLETRAARRALPSCLQYHWVYDHAD